MLDSSDRFNNQRWPRDLQRVRTPDCADAFEDAARVAAVRL